MLWGHSVGGPGQGSSGPLVRRFMYEGGIGGEAGRGKGDEPAGPDRSRPIFTSRISAAASRSVPSVQHKMPRRLLSAGVRSHDGERNSETPAVNKECE